MALVSVGFHKVADLCGRRENWRLCVKLIRLWKMSAVATRDDPFAMHMLFVDQQVVFILKPPVTFEYHLLICLLLSLFLLPWEVYNLSNFSVSRNGGKFRATHHDYKLTFNANTKIVPCPSVAIPDTGLSLVKTSEIMKTKGSSQYLIDFMAIVTGISEELTLNKENRQTRLMLIDMVDEMGKIRCAIFGQLIDTVKGFLTLPRCGLPVLIIHLARVNLYRGEVGIQNLMNASKLLWNPEIPVAVEFKNGLAVHEIETDVAISLISDNSRPISIREQFLKMFPRRRVGDLNHLLEDGTYIVHGTITEVFQDDDWWYIACSCMKAVDFTRGFPYCDGCKREVYDMSP
ncbi:Nucleic acid-binding, OB-fold, partial [Sesbania bispinosa]